MADEWFAGIAPGREGPPPAIDTSVAHIARVYDYWLGGKDDFAPDPAGQVPGLLTRLSRTRPFCQDKAGCPGRVPGRRREEHSWQCGA